MAKKKSKKTTGEMVTLYAEGLPSREFNPEHARRLLKRNGTKWSDQPFEKGGGSTDNPGNGTSDNSTGKGLSENKE